MLCWPPATAGISHFWVYKYLLLPQDIQEGRRDQYPLVSKEPYTASVDVLLKMPVTCPFLPSVVAYLGHITGP